MKQTILSVAYPLTPVGPDAIGGSEQILTLLDRALTEAGHHSIVLAAEGSKVYGTHVPSPVASGILDESVRRRGRIAHRRLIRQALDRYSVDLVHMHSLDFHYYVPPPGVPVLTTLHLPPDWYPRKIFREKRSRYYLNCVSRSQMRACPASPHLLAPIPNGVDVHRFNAVRPKRNMALSMGRICPEKGFHLALDAARMTGMEFVLAGEVFPYEAHQEYFRKKIKRRLTSTRRFVGPLGFERKKQLLSEARCLLIPSLVQETSSLVAMEALACGTPVIAFPSGALPEIVEDGRTGFLVANVKQMAEAMRRVHKIDPEACREAARTRFSARTMTTRYLDLYTRLIENHIPVPQRAAVSKAWQLSR